MEEFQSEVQKYNISPEEIAKQYAEGIRTKLLEIKSNKIDAHFKDINPEELTFEDLMIYDKVSKGNLYDHEKEFKEYVGKLNEYFLDQKKLKGNNIDQSDDSRMNFLAFLRNKSLENVYLKRFPEKRAA
jgi:hypothetical protein